mgnify:CR=1 FL=1
MNYLNELKKLEILHVDNYQYIESKKLNKDEYLLHQGEKLNYIYILLRGKVKVLTRMEIVCYAVLIVPTLLLGI